jgi:CheY-like chemotaxis protein
MLANLFLTFLAKKVQRIAVFQLIFAVIDTKKVIFHPFSANFRTKNIPIFSTQKNLRTACTLHKSTLMKKIGAICIIDDDEIYQMFTKKVIQNLDLCDEILSFVNGEEAILGLKQMIEKGDQVPGIIFLDINMPVMDGWEFMEEFIQLQSLSEKKITIYIVSSSIAPGDQDKAKTYVEISGFMVKPMKSETILEVIQSKLAEA